MSGLSLFDYIFQNTGCTMISTEYMIRLGALALLFGRTNRATFHEDGVTPESDTDHTVMLGLVACAVARELDDFQPGRTAEMCLVHDLVEAYVGDTNSFDISKSDRESKHEREEKALARLRVDYGEDSWLIETLEAYELQKEPEACLVRYLDKAMPKITHMFNHCTGIKAMGKTHDDMVRAHRTQLESLNAEYPDLAPLVGHLLADIMVLSEGLGVKPNLLLIHLKAARDLAKVRHELAGSRYGDDPYTVHLDAVRSVAFEFGVLDPDILVATLLHDILEDTDTRKDDISGSFGYRVMELVDAVTDPPGFKMRIDRKRASYPRIVAVDGAVVLKLADRIANVRSCKRGDRGRLEMYRREHPSFAKALKPSSVLEMSQIEVDMWRELDGLLPSRQTFMGVHG